MRVAFFPNPIDPDIEMRYLRTEWCEEGLFVALPQGDSPKGCGIGSGRLVAKLAAPGEVREGEERAFLAPMSVSCLPVNSEVVRRLNVLGIERLGHLAALDQSDLIDLFGRLGRDLWRWAHGIDERPIPFQDDPQLWESSVEWEEPAVSFEQIAQGLERALDDLGGLIGALEIELVGAAEPFEMRFASPTSKPLPYLLTRIRQIELAGPVEALHLTVTERGQPAARQLSLFEEPDHLAPLIARFRQWGEPQALMRSRWDNRDSALPERRAHLESVISPGTTRPLCMPRPAEPKRGEVLDQWEVFEGWWTAEPIRRAYVHLRLESGADRLLFEDRIGGGWYVHRA